MLLTREIVARVMSAGVPSEGYAVVAEPFAAGTRFALTDGYQDGVLRVLPMPGHWLDDSEIDAEVHVMEGEAEKLSVGMKIRVMVRP